MNLPIRLTPTGGLADAHDDLLIWLEFAVPLAAAELAAKKPRERALALQNWPLDAGLWLGHCGDTLMFAAPDGRRPASTRRVAANTAERLAKGIAAAAYRPGGITVADRHWCADHSLCTGGES